MNESWRKVWRAAAPLLSTGGLTALAKALRDDDPRLIQGATTTPPPISCVLDWPCEAGCLFAYCGWQGDGLDTVGEVEEAFARVCWETDQALGEPAGCRWLLNWFDETPRETVIRELLPEVELALSTRADRTPPPTPAALKWAKDNNSKWIPDVAPSEAPVRWTKK